MNELVNQVRATHKRAVSFENDGDGMVDYVFCMRCGEWPCDAIKLASLIERLEGQLGETREIAVAALDKLDTLIVTPRTVELVAMWRGRLAVCALTKGQAFRRSLRKGVKSEI